METKSTDPQNSKHTISWAEYDRDIRELTRQVRNHVTISGRRFDIILTKPRGGLCIAAHLAYLLSMKNVTFSVIHEGGKKKVLIVDDVSDSGTTLSRMKTHCSTNVEMYYIATLHRKDGTTCEPDFHVKTINKWIVYPWEI